MHQLLMDVTHSLRRLARTPAFTAVALVTLALGIGANTAVSSIVESVLLKALPYGDPTRVVMLWHGRDPGETSWLSASEVMSYAREARSLEGVAAYTNSAANLTGPQEPERVITAAVTPNLFHVLRVNAVYGRSTFAPEEAPAASGDGASGATAVILANDLWRRRFGADHRIIGRQLLVNGQARTIVGVLPPLAQLPLDFRNGRPTELFFPLALDARGMAGWGNRSLIGVARLRDDATPELASTQLAAAEEGWVREGLLQDRTSPRRAAIPVRDLILGDTRLAILVLAAAVGLILLIASANVANLMLSRSDDRRGEMVIRTALGASRARLVALLLTESGILALGGGALGAALGYGGIRVLVAMAPAGVPRIAESRVDGSVLAFTFLVAAATGVLSGLAPALTLSRTSLAGALRDSRRAATLGGRQQRFRDSLVVAQTGLSVVLLVGAVLLLRSLTAMQRIDLGFNTRDVLTFRLTLPQTSYAESRDVIALYRTLSNSVAQLPGVRAVGAARLLPLTGTIGDWSISVEGRPAQPGENPNGDWQVVTPGYLESMGIPLARGRTITDSDDERAPAVAVINETMAARYWSGGDALGKRFKLGDASSHPWITIVGIVRQVRHNAVREEPRGEMYIPHTQFAADGASTPRGMTVVVRSTGNPLALVSRVREAVHALDADLPVADVRTIGRVVSDALSQPRFTTGLLGLFASIALTLAAIGIYGVLSLAVVRRRQEIGIRLALGARPGRILRMVLSRGMMLAAIGLTVGMTCAVWVTRLLATLLYGVTRFDAVTLCAVPLLLGAVSLVACLIPAVRASSVDPAIALRDA